MSWLFLLHLNTYVMGLRLIEILFFSVGIIFMCQNLMSTDVGLWRIKTVPALKELNTDVSWSIVMKGGGPRVVVSTAAFHARFWGSFPGLGDLKKKKKNSSPSTHKTQYCGESPWRRRSVLGIRLPGFEFRILCLEGSVISLISPSSGGSPDTI